MRRLQADLAQFARPALAALQHQHAAAQRLAARRHHEAQPLGLRDRTQVAKSLLGEEDAGRKVHRRRPVEQCVRGAGHRPTECPKERAHGVLDRRALAPERCGIRHQHATGGADRGLLEPQQQQFGREEAQHAEQQAKDDGDPEHHRAVRGHVGLEREEHRGDDGRHGQDVVAGQQGGQQHAGHHACQRADDELHALGEGFATRAGALEHDVGGERGPVPAVGRHRIADHDSQGGGDPRQHGRPQRRRGHRRRRRGCRSRRFLRSGVHGVAEQRECTGKPAGGRRQGRFGVVSHGRQHGEQPGLVGRRAEILRRDTREALDGELHRQQMQPGVFMPRQLRGTRLRQHHHVVETLDLAAQRRTRAAGPGARLDRGGDAVQHVHDPGMDRMTQALQLGARPFRQQQAADQRGVAGGEQQHHQPHRQTRRWLVGDQADEVADQRDDADGCPTRTAQRTVGHHEHDQRQQRRRGERPVEQQRRDRGGGEGEHRRQRDGDEALPHRAVAHVRRDEQGDREAQQAVGHRHGRDAAQQHHQKKRQQPGERGAQRGEQAQGARVGRKQQFEGTWQDALPFEWPGWL